MNGMDNCFCTVNHKLKVIVCHRFPVLLKYKFNLHSSIMPAFLLKFCAGEHLNAITN